MRADRPSSTARLIARCSLLAATDGTLSPLVPAASILPLRAILDLAGGNRWFDFALRHAATRALLLGGERLVLPGIIAHYLARKRWLEQRVIAALDRGCRQVVVLGAGFDPVAWRLHTSHPHVQFFELDHPATQRPKVAALAYGENLSFLAADFARNLPSEVLRTHPRFDPHRSTCVLAEGLLMYFPATRVAEILLDLVRLPAAAIAFTCMAPGPDGRAAFRGGSVMINAWLRFRREPFAWAIASDDLENFLWTLGLRLDSLAGADELRKTILAPAGLAGSALAEGEYLCLAVPP